MKVYVLVSHCGLNGPWVHGVYSNLPSDAAIEAARLEAAHTTGYQYTDVEEHELLEGEE